MLVTDKAQRREWLVYALNRPLAFAVLEIAGWLGAIVRVPRVGHVVSDAEIGRRVLTDTEHFDSHSPGSLGTLFTQVLGPFALLNMDGAEHHEVKRRLMEVFSPKYIAALLSAATGRLVTELHEHLRAGQTLDFVEFMKPVKLPGIFWAAVNEPPPHTRREETSIQSSEVISPGKEVKNEIPAPHPALGG